MANLPEVPTDELLLFHEFTPVHGGNVGSTAQIKISVPSSPKKGVGDAFEENTELATTAKSFWTLEYYQQFFDVDTTEVTDRLFASLSPKQDNFLKNQIKYKPDLYGPFWIAVTLIFAIAISGNIANYLQHANEQYHWKYDFHLVSYAATTITLYITIIPLSLWGLLKWSSDIVDLEGIEADASTGALEIICIYGYSLFIYIPVSILWTIQINWFQWLLVIIAALLSGWTLMSTLMPALKLSRHKLLFTIGIIVCHVLLAAGFMLYFFHVPNSSSVSIPINGTVTKTT